MTNPIMIRRIRCGHLEAVIAGIARPDGEIRYGVFFHRLASSEQRRDHPLFDYGELLTIAKLARLAHGALRLLIEQPDDPTEH
jgi:hypothetical protein